MMKKYFEAESRIVELEEIMRIHLCIDLEFKCNEYSFSSIFTDISSWWFYCPHTTFKNLSLLLYTKVVSNWFYDQMIYLKFWIHVWYFFTREVLIFLQVWCLENLKGKGALDMIAMIHWGNIHLVKTWKEIETLM